LLDPKEDEDEEKRKLKEIVEKGGKQQTK